MGFNHKTPIAARNQGRPTLAARKLVHLNLLKSPLPVAAFEASNRAIPRGHRDAIRPASKDRFQVLVKVPGRCQNPARAKANQRR
jgi:hypothetical protein